VFFDKLDGLSGTPLLDIKPFFPGFDIPENPNSGWLNNIKDLSDGSSDGRFV
jgi:tRNA (adenine37-N6)-methyltransferase